MMNNEIHLLSELLQKYVDDSGEVITLYIFLSAGIRTQ